MLPIGGALSLMMTWNYCLCIKIFFSYNYLIVDGQKSFTNKGGSSKIYEINQRLKLWARVAVRVLLQLIFLGEVLEIRNI